MWAWVDIAVVVVRGVVFVALLQAVGAVLLRLTVEPLPEEFDAFVRRIVRVACIVAVIALLIRCVLEPARMAGSLSGMTDAFLWSLFWQSDVAVAQELRLFGAALLFAAMTAGRSRGRIASWLGVALIVASFAAMGHTRTHAGGALLGALLVLHVLVAAFWLGALLPLLQLLLRAPSGEAARILERFSTLAVRAVPALFVAGVLLASVLIGSFEGLATTYGQLVLLKVALFFLLLCLAAANRYRWAPRLARDGDRGWLQRSIAAEIVLMVGVLGVTATMTTLHSPD